MDLTPARIDELFRRNHLGTALTKLDRATDHNRLGPTWSSLLYTAADLLDAAGERDLADEAEMIGADLACAALDDLRRKVEERRAMMVA